MRFQENMQALKKVVINLRRMLRLAWEVDRKLTAFYYLTGAVGAVAPVLISISLKYLLDGILLYQGVTTIPLVLIAVLAGRYAILVGESLVRWGLNRSYYDYLLRYKLQNELNRRFYQKLAHLDISYFEDPKTQDLIAKAKDTMTWRPPDFLRMFMYFFESFTTFISAFIVLLPFGWWIPFVVTIATLPRLYLRTKYGTIQWSLYGSGAPEARKLWYFMSLLSSPTAIREMRLFQSHRALLTKFMGIQDYLLKLNKKGLDGYLQSLALPAFLEASILFVFAFLKLPVVLAGTLSVGSFTLFINIIDRVSAGAAGSIEMLGYIYEHSLYVDHYFEVLTLPKRIHEVEKPLSFENMIPPTIEFKDVSFRYPDGPLVLKHISFVINPGEGVAFVGANGAGKSTIIKLLCRFYDVTEGEILINNVNIKQLKLANWYQFLGTLFQDFVQYHFTVRENIALGNPTQEDEKRIKEAAIQSGAAEFIEKLPKKYDQVLGREFEDGEELSIGQWQKLAIARAFYEEAPVLILDEPTSAIDAEAEYEIFNNLERVYKNKTLILVSHRFSTVRNANKIFVVESGEIIERGTHEELLSQNGKYARMFTTQAKGYQ